MNEPTNKSIEDVVAGILDFTKEGEYLTKPLYSENLTNTLTLLVQQSKEEERERIESVVNAIQTNDGTLRAAVEHVKLLILNSLSNTPKE